MSIFPCYEKWRNSLHYHHWIFAWLCCTDCVCPRGYPTSQNPLAASSQIREIQNEFSLSLFASGTRALWALDQKDEATARACLEESLPLIRDQGLQFLHNWPKPKFSLLCAKALEWGIEVEFVQNLVRKYHLIPEQPPLTNLNWPWTLRIKTLGGFAVETDGQLLTFAKKLRAAC